MASNQRSRGKPDLIPATLAGGTGMSSDFYATIATWFGRLRGRLSMATALIAAGGTIGILDKETIATVTALMYCIVLFC